MGWNRESSQPAAQGISRHGLLLHTLLLLTTVKDLSEAFALCVIGHSRLFVILPRWAAVCVMAVAVLRLLAIIGIWRLSRLAVLLYLLLGFAALVLYMAVHSSVGNPLVSAGWAVLIALVSALRWRQFSWWH